MKSDLTCPVEITKVTVSRETEHAKESEQVVCLIEFFNLSHKTIDSLQMNIVCFDADDTRLGGRLVRAAAPGAPRERFCGTFVPEHVDGAVRVEAAVEKVWFQDGVVWRREERNVREYTPNALPEGRELDRLRAVAGADAAGYAREDDIVWMCVCGRANPTSDDTCVRCERKREQVLRDYSYAAIDSTAGRRERALEEQTRDTLRRSSETTVREQTEIQKKSRRRRRALGTAVGLLVAVAALLAGARWGVPYGACWWAQRQMAEGKLSDAKAVYAFVERYWPGLTDAAQRAREAEMGIIEGLIAAGTDTTLEEAASRADALGDAPLHERAVLTRAQLVIDSGDTDKAEALLTAMPDSEAAQAMHSALSYDLAMAARKRVDYPTAIERLEALGDYSDAPEQLEECRYDYGRQLLREGHYAQASEQLLRVSGRGDAIELIRRCRYALAQEAQEAGQYIDAARDYESLGVYEEAESRARLCRYTAGVEALTAGDLELAAEQFKAAEGYEDAQARFEETALALGMTALEQKDYVTAIAWLEQLPREGEAGAALNRAGYAYAAQLEQAGQLEAAALEFAALGSYEDAPERARAIEYALACQEMDDSPETALPRFEGLGSYKDARDKARACRYAIARACYDEGHYEEAVSRFDALDDYEDAAAQARRSRYAQAGEAVDEQRYDDAAALYEACGAYLDAEDRAMRARYEKAAALSEAGEYEQAARAFAALGSYEDAKLRVTQNEDAWLLQPRNSARMDTELGDYASVIRTLEPLWQSELPERYADIRSMYITACLERAKALTDMRRPLDALPLLESIREVSETARKRLDAYVYRIIGRWKDSRGVEYVFRRDGSCVIAGEAGYYGGSGYEITFGSEPYPTRAVLSVVSLRGKAMTLRDLETRKNIRLSYVGEAEETAPEEEPDADAPDGE